MKKLTRYFSILLALVLGLSVCCTGLAEEESAYNQYVMDYFAVLLKLIPGGDKIDWDGFAKAFDEKVKSGAEITLEDCLPPEGWQFIGSLLRMEENGEIDDEKDLLCSMDLTVSGNTISTVHKLKEQSDESTIKDVSLLLKADLESELSLSYLKQYLDQLIEAGVNKDNIKMTMQYLNADGTVIEEASYTYADLEAAVGNTIQSYYAAMFSLIPNEKTIDWDAFTKAFEETKNSGAKITLEDCLPAESWNLLNVLMRMDDSSKIWSAEELPFTVDVTVKGNSFAAVHQLKEKMNEVTAWYLVQGIRADYETPLYLLDLKEMFDWFGVVGLDLDDVTLNVKYLDTEGATLYEKAYTYADLLVDSVTSGAF